jgi:1,4-alpha-glucan branching enzyme
MTPIKQARSPLRQVNVDFCAPSAGEVFLAGEFNDWNTTSMPLHRGPDGNWHIELMLPAGIYRYKFLVDSVWRCSPDHPQDRCDRPCEACPRCVPNLFGSVDRILIV